jgi:PPOX class probable F420-dependent enzyme
LGSVRADLDLVRRLAAAEHGLVVVATARTDGSVHASVVNAGVLDDPMTNGAVVGLVVAGSTVKLRLLRAAGRATVIFRAGWEWASVEGPVRCFGPDDVPDGFAAGQLPQLLRDVFTAAGGTHDNWDEYDRVMVAEGRVAVLVEPHRITTNG